MNADFVKMEFGDFEKKLSKPESLFSNGKAYEVLKKGETLGYFVPAQYEISLTKKRKHLSQRGYKRVLQDAIGSIELKDEIRHVGSDYMKGYRILLEKKYLRK